MEDTSPKSENDAVPWSQWWGMAVLMTAIFAGLEFMVYTSLAPLERGEVRDAAVWMPIGIVYELAGFIAAMSVIPIMWTFCASIVAWQTWKRIKSERQESPK